MLWFLKSLVWYIGTSLCFVSLRQLFGIPELVSVMVFRAVVWYRETG